MFRTGENIASCKWYYESYITLTVWHLKWVTTYKNNTTIKEMIFDDRCDAYERMCYFLKRNKCSWIEQENTKILYRQYPNEVSYTKLL